MPEIKIKSAFELGADIYLRTDPQQIKGLLVAVMKNWNGSIEYKVKYCDDYAWYQSIELNEKKDESIKPPKEEETDEED